MLLDGLEPAEHGFHRLAEHIADHREQAGPDGSRQQVEQHEAPGRDVTEADRHRRDIADAVDEAEAEDRSEEHTSELQSLMRISYAVVCLKKKKKNDQQNYKHFTTT